MRAALVAGSLLTLLVMGCSTPAPLGPGGVHVVRRGETLWSISQRYGTSVEQLARANHIRDFTQIRVGQRLRIPGRGTAVRKGSSAIWTATDPRGSSGHNAFIWPVRGSITSGYGVRNGAHHDGIDISVRKRTPVRAVEAGRVVHSDDSLAGYGKMIIVKHRGAFSSVYAHNHKNLVRVGDFVEQGQVIAESGQSGRASAPHLHFEIRRDGRAINPLSYLR